MRRIVPKPMAPTTALAVLILLCGAACDGAHGDLLSVVPQPVGASDQWCVTRVTTDPAFNGLCATPTTWRAIAEADCEALGLVLPADDLQTGAACEPDAAGRERFTEVKYACCLPDTCRLERQGDGTACQDEATWLELARRACAVGGLELRGPLSVEACADGATFRGVVYACCPAATGS